MGASVEAARLVDTWLAEQFTSADEATADLARRIASRIQPRDEEINRLARLLWKATRQHSPDPALAATDGPVRRRDR